MNETYVFHPNRRLGSIFHALLAIALILLGVWSLWRSANADIGPVFLLYLLPALFAVFAFPLVVYRAYALIGASYQLERDGIRLRWGLRVEEIPVDVVEWIYPARELSPRVPRPFIRMPGAVLGVRRLPGGGEVEFMASNTSKLLVISTPGKAYAISPSDPEDFLGTYHSLMELGSITPIQARSVYPTFLLSRVWASRVARILILLGAILCLVFIFYIVLAIPSRVSINLGFSPNGNPGDLVPAVRLLLLPVLCVFFFVADLLLGLFLYRDENNQYLAYLIWAVGALTPMLFFIGTYFILNSG